MRTVQRCTGDKYLDSDDGSGRQPATCSSSRPAVGDAGQRAQLNNPCPCKLETSAKGIKLRMQSGQQRRLTAGTRSREGSLGMPTHPSATPHTFGKFRKPVVGFKLSPCPDFAQFTSINTVGNTFMSTMAMNPGPSPSSNSSRLGTRANARRSTCTAIATTSGAAIGLIAADAKT